MVQDEAIYIMVKKKALITGLVWKQIRDPLSRQHKAISVKISIYTKCIENRLLPCKYVYSMTVNFDKNFIIN